MQRILKYKYLFVIAIAAMSIVLNGCSDEKKDITENNNSLKESTKEGVKTPKMGGSITVGIPQDIGDSLDPHKAVGAGTKEILFNIFEGLVKPDEKGNLQPAVAEDYQVSEDGKTYTFSLREGVLFHTGKPVTVEDIKYSIERCADTSNGGPLVSAFSNIERIEITSPKEVQIFLKEVDSEFLSYMTTAIIPAEIGEEIGKNPIGTGPFQYVDRSYQENIKVEKFPKYWGKAAYLDQVTFKVVADTDMIVTSLESGAIDMYARLTSTQAQLLEDHVAILEGTMNLVQGLYLNNEDPILQDAKVRQALNYSINTQEIMDFIADGKGQKIGSAMIPGLTKYYDPTLEEYYTVDITKAKKLLAEAGYPDGFELTIQVPSNYQPHIDTAQILIEQLKKVGIQGKIELIEWDSWLNQVYKEHKYQATVVGIDAPTLTGRALLERYKTGESGNFMNYSNEEYDRLLEATLHQSGQEEVVQGMKDLQKILTEDAASVYLQDMANFVGLNKKYSGYKFYPLYVQDMASIYMVE